MRRILAEAVGEVDEAADWLEDTGTFAREIRRCVLHRLSYVVVFEIVADQPVVLAVDHGRRKPNYWIGRSP